MLSLLLFFTAAVAAGAQPAINLGDVYSIADKAYEQLAPDHNISGHIVIADFSRPSEEKRLFVYDAKNDSMVFQALVAHGKNTGGRLAHSFSNEINSNQSSLGFYRISEQYQGKYGDSYRLDGLDPGYNNNARKRAIVMHPAWYVSQEMIAKHGRIGRSYGCPSLSKKDFEKFSQLVQPGSLLFVYYPDEKYFRESAVVKQLQDLDHLFDSLEL